MAYQVLARKYRPEKFQEVIGQEHVTRTLLNAFARDRIAHAYLFAGPRGVGKTTTARILAKALNCLTNSDGNPCDECENCREISASRSMDVLEIDGASNRGIDEIRNLRELVKYAPINAKFKVFVIDEVHMLTPQAFNALLKTLEEPPPHVKFVFATTEPNKVLPTILSRCQRHDFHRLSMEHISSGMKSVAEKEGMTVDDKTEQVIATMADGSMRDALSLLDQVVAFCGNEVSFEQATSMLRIIPSSLFFDLTDTIKKKDRRAVLHLMNNVHAQGYSLADFLSGLNRHFLNLLICKADSGSELLELTEDMNQRYLEESKDWDARDLLRYTDLIAQIESNLKRVQQPNVYVETMMLKLVEMESTVSIGDLISRIEGGGTGGVESDSGSSQRTLFADSNRPKPSEEPNVADSDAAQEPNSPNTDPLQAVKDRWEEIISEVSKNGTSLSTFLGHGTLTGLKGKRLIISFPEAFRFQIDVLKKNAMMIESIIENRTGHGLKMDLVVDKDERSSSENETHPVTKRMLELFGGKIVE